jgi:hypothetical protein
MVMPAWAQESLLSPECPPDWEESLVFYQSFDADHGNPVVNQWNLTPVHQLKLVEGGRHGKYFMPVEEKETPPCQTYKLDNLSLDKPMTVMFWWKLLKDVGNNESFDMIYTGREKQFISCFARGGPWSALTQTAGVAQIWNYQGNGNISRIFDKKLHQTLNLKTGQWHHTAMIISSASRVQFLIDGKQVFDHRLTGRPFNTNDQLTYLRVGSYNRFLGFDELMLFDKPLDPQSIAYYYSLSQMK